MTGFFRGALAVTAGLALITTSSMAGVPSPANSTVDEVLVGNASGAVLPKAGGFGTTDQGAAFIVTVRDILGALVDGVEVRINFSTRAGNTGPIGAVVEANPFSDAAAPGSFGYSMDCATKTIYKNTGAGGDPAGTAIFRPRFQGAENTASIEVRAGGVLLAVVKARSTAADGDGNTALTDLGIFQENYGPSQGEESDFSLDGPVNLVDLGLFQSEYEPPLDNATPCL